MWGKISDDLIMTCQNCGRQVNIYTEYAGLVFSKSVRTAIQIMTHVNCPKCGKKTLRNY